MSAPVGYPRDPLDAPPRLTGREREQKLLGDYLAAALSGRGGLVLIDGEAGIGKTTIAEELCRRATDAGALVLIGRCYDFGETPPYGPWLDLLGRIDVLGDLMFRLRDTISDRIVASGGQLALFQQVRDNFARLAARQPLVFLLDDLHWADPASLDLLRFLAHDLPTLPLLILTTYRSDELNAVNSLAQRLPLLAREPHAIRLSLQPLRTEAVRSLLAERYRLGEGDAARLTAYLDARAEGNPLYLGELLRTLEEVETLRETAAGWVVGDLTRVRVPLLLRQIVTDRLFRVGKEGRELLRVAAVIGQEAPYELWLAVSAVDEDRLNEVIEHAETIGVLEERPDGAGARFRHALLREAVYEGIPALGRRRLHRLVGDALMARSNPDPDAVAYHFQQAGDARAAEWLLRAGQRAQRAYAWLTAADRYETALALLGEGGIECDGYAWLLMRLALLRRYADPERTIAHLDAASQHAIAPALVAAIRYYRGAMRCLNDDLSGGLPEMVAGVAALDGLPLADLDALIQRWDEEIGDDAIGRRHGILATWLSIAGRFNEARALAESVSSAPLVPLSPPGPGGLRAVDVYAALARAYAVRGQPEEARLAMGYAREGYRAAGNFALRYMAIGDQLNLFALPYATDDVAGREYLTREAEGMYRQAASATADDAICPLRYRLLLLEGRWTEIQPAELEALASTDAQLPLARNVIGLLAHKRGQPLQAWRRVRAILSLGYSGAPGGADFRAATEMQCLAAELALDAGDLPAAREWLEAHDRWLAWADAALGRAEGHLGWAAYHRAADDLSLASQHANQALSRAGAPRQPLALLLAHRLLGELDTEAGHHAEADRHLAAALALAEACATPHERALTLLALAELRGVTDARDEALALLAEARAICAPLDARPALARADALAKRLASARTAPKRLPDGLSAREAEVLRLVALGLSDTQVAERLFLSPRTVTTHLTSIYKKTGAPSRIAAARFAIENDLATDEATPKSGRA